ncbi:MULTISPECIES: hypothetical protein [unclassified Chitinophaga]|uniref:hypothetical protein n=1 Tax=unclassified Chitinophaga TaxID=2619133 RepID=UPI0009CB947A|nr:MULTISPECIES: hypothetical protein [unclassified Chitinophaga]OMP75148.1 hypothetical protein BW716_31610 [[Flexibacter] sp. ATCC 35208]WPV63876.1 hypothetical protein QQL36_18930 [Chitinophaga sp. LS1]
MKTKNNWTDIINRVLKGEENIVSPFDKEGIIESIFVLVQKDTGMGWGLVWCSKTHRGVRLSRMQIPDTVKSVFTNDLDSYLDSIPKIEFESID